MGIQIWTSDQSPQIRMAGANALAEGIGRAGQSLGDSLGKAMEEKKRQGQLASSLRKTLSVAFPDRKDEFNTMGLPDLQGELEGQALASARQRQQQQQASLAASLQAQAEERANAARFPAFAQAIGEMGQAPDDVPGPLNNAEFDRRTRPVDLASVMAAAGRTGYRPNEGSLDDLMRAAKASRPELADSLNFQEDPVTGERFATFGKSMASSGTNPDKLKAKPQAPLQPRVVIGTNPMTQEPQVTWSGSPEDFKKAFPSMKIPGDQPQADSAPTGGPAKVTTQKEYDALKPGSIYIGKDGRKYKKP